ncbi:MAG: flagellar motor switch protein FliG [Firmicutes bacterium]|uniref:Flagellar motor switch protein FliG n=1 Tax=Sulfobacillus benefaciens TaxID=453960 RepID=A0A2T2X6I5_9FIRM|nr:flagellar motor switch protein FliG [Bacillota bacterium]MCL5015687.1 flagellar motor switch protein FliG [Bacillota bacterium]PSR30113.1 MAG: flagellar motor switch protein FliG [Sulfobacillus benefaciens]
MSKLRMSGSRKAAVLLMAVGSQQAATLLRYLRRSEVEAITMEIANLKRVDGQVVDDVVTEFYEMSKAEQQLAEGGIDMARDMLERAFDGPRAQEILQRLTGFLQRRPFEVLRKADPSQVMTLMMNEHPQTIAVVLAYMDPTQASAVLSSLDAELQSDVARRIAVMGRAAPEVIKEIEQLMEKKLTNLAAEEISGAGGINAIVPILNNTDRTSERLILQRLEEFDPELADEIRNRMFVFENIVQIDDRAMQKVLRRVDNKTLSLALKGTPPEVSQKVMRNLSQKAADLLREDIEVLGPVRIRDVEQAQREIVNVIRQLEDQGELVISRGERDDFVV